MPAPQTRYFKQIAAYSEFGDAFSDNLFGRVYACTRMQTENAMRTIFVASTVCTLALGCAGKQVDVWIPPPRVGWDDVSTHPVPPIADEYKILRNEPTKGLFPCNMAVSRVAVNVAEDDDMTLTRQLIREPRNEFLAWNSAFDDQMAVSEVFPITQRDLGGAPVDPRQIIAANRALSAKIALVYAMNELSETESEMIGALYSTEGVEPIAAVHARAKSVEPLASERNYEPTDLWETDSKALVREKFERIVYACVRELIHRDEPAIIQAPSGWTPAGPIRPVEWPPRQYRRGR